MEKLKRGEIRQVFPSVKDWERIVQRDMYEEAIAQAELYALLYWK